MISSVEFGRFRAGVVCQCPDVEGEHVHQVSVDPIPCGCCGKAIGRRDLAIAELRRTA
jgi:hypothetical protein